MIFKEWFNEDDHDHDLYNYPEEAMEAAWDHQQVAIDKLQAEKDSLSIALDTMTGVVSELEAENTQLRYAWFRSKDYATRSLDDLPKPSTGESKPNG